MREIVHNLPTKEKPLDIINAGEEAEKLTYDLYDALENNPSFMRAAAKKALAVDEADRSIKFDHNGSRYHVQPSLALKEGDGKIYEVEIGEEPLNSDDPYTEIYLSYRVGHITKATGRQIGPVSGKFTFRSGIHRSEPNTETTENNIREFIAKLRAPEVTIPYLQAA